MKRLLLFSFLLLSLHASAQWSVMNIANGARYEDLFFTDDSTGYTCNANGEIWKSVDGGNNWDTVFTCFNYLRSIEFITPDIGFCGSLDYGFYKTWDSGNTWYDIGWTLDSNVHGICGLNAATSAVIYGVGVWSGPAYLIKSIDTGITWTFIDMSPYASGLIDVYFLNADTGFVTGNAMPATAGAVILKTTDGGTTWTPVAQTNGIEYVWKIQTPDKQHFYASIESDPGTNNTRYLSSSDSGNTWQVHTIRNYWSYVQAIGFADTLHGWLGNQELFRTNDGGVNWDIINFGGSTYDRFCKVNDSISFLTGAKIYKYVAGTTTATEEHPYKQVHTLSVSPNPSNGIFNAELNLHRATMTKLYIQNNTGEVVKSIINERLSEGKHVIPIDLSDYNSQLFYLVMRTNECMLYSKIIKQ